MDPRLIAAFSVIVGTLLVGGVGFWSVSQLDFQFSGIAPSLGAPDTGCEWVDHPKGDGFSSTESFFDAYEANTNSTREQIQELADFRVSGGGIQYRTCEVNN